MQGAAGQERGDRAGRRQGRLPAQAAAARRHARRRSRRRASPPTASSSRRCSTSPTTSSTARVVPPRARRAPRRRRSLSRGRRRQGHRDLLRHRQRASRPAATSGSATRSPRAARPATTTRRWASPRAAPGNASSATSARWTSTSRRQPFTVIGVGDMSGDVFGNGMLLSPAIRLVAAFDHRDIFLDPDPDPAKSLAERKRLFALPRSSWQDYDKALISKGGGVFSRSSKSIPLSAEVRALLGTDKRGDDAGRADQRDPQGETRSAVVRRHRHLRPRLDRDRRRGRRSRQRCDPHHRRRSFAPR